MSEPISHEYLPVTYKECKERHEELIDKMEDILVNIRGDDRGDKLGLRQEFVEVKTSVDGLTITVNDMKTKQRSNWDNINVLTQEVQKLKDAMPASFANGGSAKKTASIASISGAVVIGVWYGLEFAFKIIYARFSGGSGN